MTSSSPYLSIIIPVYDDKEGLRQTLISLEKQKGEHPFEVIIADNGSSDGTWELAQEYSQKREHFFAIQESEIQSSYGARNRGLTLVRGEVIAFIDANMTVESTYVEKVAHRFQNTSVDYLANKVVVPETKESLSGLFNSLTGFPVDRYLARGHYAPTCCLVVRQSLFGLIGTFDHRLESGGDMEFGQRAFLAGLNQEFAEEIVMTHPPRKKLGSLIKKEKRIARGHAQLTFFYPQRYSLFRDLYLGSTKYVFPSNPIKHRRKAKERGISLSPREALVLSVLHFPISWAGFFSYVKEATRLRALQGSQRDSD